MIVLRMKNYWYRFTLKYSEFI